MGVIVHSANLVSAGEVTPDGWVRSDGGWVTSTGTGTAWREVAAPRDDIIDATHLAGPGALLTPGLIDLHGHGGGGASYDEGDEAITRARALHRSHGTTRAVLSVVSDELEALELQLARIGRLSGSDVGILGSHLEGPYLDPTHAGAHAPAYLLTPDTAATQRLIDAANGTLRQVTLAPELPGAFAAIDRFLAADARVAVGHTGADIDLARRAFEAGASILTHAFNAMPGLHHRDPGPVAAATADPRVSIEVIADGVHVHLEVVRMLMAGAPGRVALVTDAMAAAGAGDGSYRLGEQTVDVRGGIARLRDGTIAGSTLTQDAALRNAVAAGVALPAAVEALTGAPARALGLDNTYGSLEIGRVADAVLWDAALNVSAVFVAGERMDSDL